MSTLAAALLGVIQGLTEFLPVSSSAHLILARAFFGWDAERFGLAFDVACHTGTLLAVVVFYRAEIAAMIRALPRGLDPSALRRPDPDLRLVWWLVIGTVPAVIAGLLFADAIEIRLRTPVVAAVALAGVALLFFVVERVGTPGRDRSSLRAQDVLLIGCAQAVALIPGVSRSGATILMAMALGLRRDEAARFVFLLGLPAILAAAVKEGIPLLGQGLAPGEPALFLIGATTSALVGYAAITYFIRYLAAHSLAVFAWYRLALAAAVAIWWVGR